MLNGEANAAHDVEEYDAMMEATWEETVEDEEMKDLEEVEKDKDNLFEEEEGTMTESPSDSSDQEGGVLVAEVIEDYVAKEDSESEFSFDSSIGTLEDDTNTVDGFVDLAEPFDMELLRSCIENGSSAVEKAQDKDVVLVVGKTGVGYVQSSFFFFALFHAVFLRISCLSIEY